MDRMRTLEIGIALAFVAITILGFGFIVVSYIIGDVIELSENCDEEIRKELNQLRLSHVRFNEIILEFQEKQKMQDYSE